MTKINTLTIAMSAFNEQENISSLLSSLLQQNEEGFILEEIIVISDGSTDKTSEQVKKIKDKRIKLISHTERAGKTERINEILSVFKGDVLILLDADIIISDRSLFKKIFSSVNIQNHGLASLRLVPSPSRNLFERAINYSVKMQEMIRQEWNMGNNFLSFKGACLILDRKFAKKLRLPKHLVNDDAYIYFAALHAGYVPIYLTKLSVNYRSPSTFADHLRQSKRFEGSYDELHHYFGEHIAQFYRIPKSIFIESLIRAFMYNPILFSLYCLISYKVKKENHRENSTTWSVANSTKSAYHFQQGYVNFARLLKIKDTLRFNPLVYMRRGIYLTLYTFDRIFKRKNNLFILCYHAIGKDSWRYGVSRQTFEKQMRYLAKHYQFITLEDVEQYIKGKKDLTKPSVVVTIDDGYKDVLQIRAIVRKLKLKPTLFILSDRKNSNRKELDTNREFLSLKEITMLQKEGWVIGNHSATHSDFYTLNKSAVVEEVVNSKKIIEKELGQKIKYFAYPRGRYTPSVLAAIKKAGYTLSLSMNDGIINRQTDTTLVPRIGVDRTHTFVEYKAIFTPSTVQFRKIIKERIGILL